MQGVTSRPPPPPAWLRGWRRLVGHLVYFRKQVFLTLGTAVNLDLLPTEIFEAIPPVVDLPFNHPRSTCDHPEYVRYGNAYGKFAKCKRCHRRLRWNDSKVAWEDHPDKKLDTSLLTSPPPLPCSSNIASEGAASSSRASRPSARVFFLRATKKRSARRPSASSASEMDLDHWKLLHGETEESEAYDWNEAA